MHGFAGGGVDRLHIGLGAARQVDLQASMTEIQNASAESVEPTARNLGRETALDQGRQQMMAGRNVETGPDRQVGQSRLTAGFCDRFQQEKSAVDRLDAVALAVGARVANGP